MPMSYQESHRLNTLVDFGFGPYTKPMEQSSVVLSEEDISNITRQKDSLTKTVYEKLISMFLNHELVPGDVLNRRALATALGVSVAPVLEALVQLEMEGFVESMPRRGTIVRGVREKDVLEHLIVREALECRAARIYAGDPLHVNYEELMEFAATLDQSEPTSLQHMKDEIRFHASLVNLAGLQLLTREFVRIIRIGSFCNINRINSQSWTMKQQHTKLLDDLIKANELQAEEIIRDHLWSGKPILNI